MVVKVGYMDKIDFEEELENLPIIIYPSIKELQKNQSCVEECGIVQVEVRLIEVIQETQFDKE
jgi:hypothetical protein